MVAGGRKNLSPAVIPIRRMSSKCWRAPILPVEDACQRKEIIFVIWSESGSDRLELLMGRMNRRKTGGGRRHSLLFLAGVIFACNVSLTGCSNSSPQATPLQASNYIQHVVVIVQENRSFDNMFYGFPGANTATEAHLSNGSSIPLQALPLEGDYDLGHELSDFLTDWNMGRMNGFDQDGGAKKSCLSQLDGIPCPQPVPENASFSYVEHSEIVPYFTMASEYTLADDFFTSQIDSSYDAHLFLVAARSRIVNVPSNLPWGCDAPAGTTVSLMLPNRTAGSGVFPCYDDPTLGSELDAKGIDWRFYAPSIGGNLGEIWSSYDSFSQIRYGSDWNTKVVSPETTILSDIERGYLAPVSWVVPKFENSDHPGSGVANGPSWVASIVNAIGNSPFWGSTAIVVYWDDWGGYYDHVPPPQLDVWGLGVRVPMMVISPYAKHGYVSHVQYESASVAKFIETVFGLPTLGAADARANGLNDCFDFSQQPNSYVTIPQSIPAEHFLHDPPSNMAPDTD